MSSASELFEEMVSMGIQPNVVTYNSIIRGHLVLGCWKEANGVITGLVNLVATFVSVALVDRAGLRFLFIIGGVQMSLCQVVAGILILVKFRTTGVAVEISKGYAIILVAFICIFISQAFLVMFCHMKFGLFFFFGGWVVIMTIFIYFFLPETKNVPIEEMGLVWRKHRYWRKFVVEDDNKDNPV